MTNNNPCHRRQPPLAATDTEDSDQIKVASPAIERVEAVVMFCDLRDFTTLSNRLPQDDVIAVLQGYFNLVVPVIEAFGGEVLQLIGDGILAIFHDCANRNGPGCARAKDAATQIQRCLNMCSVAGRTLQAGIALHAGEVIYGEIGAGRRTSLTVIGPVVNLTSRLETLCHLTGQPILVSSAFARRIGLANCLYIGRFEFKGFDESQEVYAPLRQITG